MPAGAADGERAGTHRADTGSEPRAMYTAHAEAAHGARDVRHPRSIRERETVAALYMLLLLIFRVLHLFHFAWTKLHPWTTWFIILTVLIIVDFVLLAARSRRGSLV